jgi:hypothetical protein
MKKHSYSHHTISIIHPLTKEEVEIKVRAEVVDGGIGPYTYFGAKGVDSREELEWFILSYENGKELTSQEEDAIYNNESLLSEIEEKIWKEIEG